MEKYFHNLSVSIIRFIPRNKSIFMFKNVVVDSFDKAEKDIPGKTTKTSISEHLSEALLNDFRVQISGRTLRNLLDESNKLTSEKEDIVINSEYVQALCKYLGYEDYDSFLKKNLKAPKTGNKIIGLLKTNWLILLFSFTSVVVVLVITAFNEQKWMVWQESNYIEVDFDAKKFQQNAYKLYNEELLTHFKKVAPNCETIYFNVDESENIWYGKSKTGEIECFTLYGKHPETGKTLKPITKYMINKYFCESY